MEKKTNEEVIDFDNLPEEDVVKVSEAYKHHLDADIYPEGTTSLKGLGKNKE